MKGLPRPSANRILRQYLSDVVAWHGYVRFLGLPSYQNNPDVPIDELYVPHTLSTSYLSPDSNPKGWDTDDPVQLLLKHKRLVILGDPGSGKSTLVNWFAWYLASGFSKKLPGALASLLPLPLVLRDLALGHVSSFEGLIDAFLARPVAQGLRTHKGLLLEYLAAGQVLLLVDGLDEVDVDLRRRVRDVLLAGFAQYPMSYAVCTSRIVGYEEGAVADQALLLSKRSRNSAYEIAGPQPTEQVAGLTPQSDLFNLSATYVAPFSDEQIARFALNWYRDQVGTDLEARLLRDDFIAAIRSNDSTLRLARTPNLLTMMALIFRVRARLPNGRALLYEDIAQAYLESIDTARKLKDEFSWQSKKRWLARVGFEMQLRRVTESTQPRTSAGQELLIERQDILVWVTDAITRSGENAATGYAEKYLDWIARRSGLLLPRGEGKFAFLHLSFQEYFAALYIKQQMENPAWFVEEPDDEDAVDPRVTRSGVTEWANETLWQQSFVFLFELCAESPGWPKQLLTLCFPVGWSADAKGSSITAASPRQMPAHARAQLCLEVLSNPHSGLSQAQREAQLVPFKDAAMAEQAWLGSTHRIGWYLAAEGNLLARTLTDSLLRRYALTWLGDSAEGLATLVLNRLSAEGLQYVLPVLSRLSRLQTLVLNYTRIDHLRGLTHLTQLEHLSLNGTQVEDLGPIAGLTNLKRLFLDGTGCVDLAPLATLTTLQNLSLDGTRITDLEPLRNLTTLQDLSVSSTQIGDLSPLVGLTNLRNLSVGSTQVRDFSPLAGLKKLQFLSASGEQVRDLSPLSALRDLRFLVLMATQVENLEALRELKALEHLYLSSTRVSDIEPLAGLLKLETLALDGTHVSDVTPLAGLIALTDLSLDNTQVRDVTPLAGLIALRNLSLSGTQVSDVAPLSGLKSLRRLSLDGTRVRDLKPLADLPMLDRSSTSYPKALRT